MRRVCQVPDTSREKEKKLALCRLLDRPTRAKLQRLLPVSAHTSTDKQEQAMMRKLRIFVAALLLVPALLSNANAFTTESDGALNPARPPSNTCWYWYYGILIAYEC